MARMNKRQREIERRNNCAHTSAYLYNEEEDLCEIDDCPEIAEYNCPNCGLVVCDEHLNCIDEIARTG